MILSVSRRTDIPAFYSEWFYNRIAEGFVFVRNPINKNLVNKIELDPQKIDCIVFWTKDPKQFISQLYLLKNYNYYFQFTVNPYDNSLEVNVPRKKEVFETFAELSEKVGKHRIIWRYDPIFLTDVIDVDYHIKYFEEIAKRLFPFTQKCIISFLDLYKKCERNLRNIDARILDNDQIFFLVSILKKIASNYNLHLESCAEEINLEHYGVNHGRCIDNKLIENIIGCPLKVKKDKNQRSICGCIESIDIGEYNTCKHNCKYCYANFNSEIVKENVSLHDPKSPILIGNLKSTDELKVREIESFKTANLFKG